MSKHSVHTVCIKELPIKIKVVDNCCIDSTIGTFNCADSVIEIKIGLSEEQLYRTIAHEITHAVIWAYGFVSFENFSEENVCDFVSIHMDEIMKETKAVYKKILEDYYE